MKKSNSAADLALDIVLNKNLSILDARLKARDSEGDERYTIWYAVPDNGALVVYTKYAPEYYNSDAGVYYVGLQYLPKVAVRYDEDNDFIGMDLLSQKNICVLEECTKKVFRSLSRAIEEHRQKLIRERQDRKDWNESHTEELTEAIKSKLDTFFNE